MSAPTDAEVAQLADTVVLPRVDFERIHDELATARGSRRFKITALMSEPGKAIHRAFLTARDGGWFDELTERLWQADAFRALEEPGPQTGPVKATLQAVVQPRAGLVAVDNLNLGSIHAAKRVCRVEVAGDEPTNGTGFLVGPQAILTARHVIEGLLDGNGRPRPGSHMRLRIHFDDVGGTTPSQVCQVQPNWLVGSSACHHLERPPATMPDIDAAPADEFSDCLDYALIRLEKAKGRERGFYPLDAQRSPKTGEGDCQIFLFQHPEGAAMHYANGTGIRLWPDALKNRLLHDANSLKGSSGGLIVDKTFQLVAMHQCGYHREDGEPYANGAIPTACIAARGDPVDVVIGVDPIWQIPATGQPVIGRLGFQDAVMSTLGGSNRIIAVRGGAESGKSFSAAILRAMIDESSNIFLELDASAIPIEALSFVERIFAMMPMPDATPLPTLPDPGAANTASEAWTRDILLPILLDGMRAYAGNRIMWLVIDGLDEAPITAGSALSLLEHLTRLCRAHNFLRMVMIGQSGAVVAAVPADVSYDDVGDLTVEDVERYLHLRYTAEGKTRSNDDIRDVAEIIVRNARDRCGPFNPALARAIVTLIGASA